MQNCILSLSIDDVNKQLRIYHIEFPPLSHTAIETIN